MGTPTVLAWIARATEEEAKRFLLNCVKSNENAKTCRDQVKKRMANIQGKTRGAFMNKREEAASIFKEKDAFKSAAAEAVQDAMEACRALNASNPNAECEDELELFQKMKGMVGSLS